MLVVIRVVLVEYPFDDVAAQVVKTPGIGFFLPDLLVLEIAVLLEPGVFRQFGG